MKSGAVAVLICASAFATRVSADGAYVGGFGSVGAYQRMGWTGPNNSNNSLMVGGFTGYAFDVGGMIVSPEARVHVGANNQIRYEFVDTASFPGFTAYDGMRQREALGGSLGVNIGKNFGQFTPYIGGSVGVSRLAISSTFFNPTNAFKDSYSDNAMTTALRGGVDYNFGRYFARADIEQRWFTRSGYSTYTKTDVSVGLGLRF